MTTKTKTSENLAPENDNPGDKERNQKLWDTLLSPQDLRQFYVSWMKLLAARSGTEKHLLIVGLSDDKVYKPLACWPEDVKPPESLVEVIEQVIDEGCGLVLDLDDAERIRYAIGYPVHVDELLQFVVAAEVEVSDEGALSGCMERLQWGSAWLEAISRRHVNQENHWKIERMSLATDLMAQVLDEESFDDAAMKLVTELAHKMDCDRVSLGLKTGGSIKVQALSHSSQFGERMNLIRSIGAAMDEAVLQNQNLVYPQVKDKEKFLICREHDQLSRAFGAKSILTVPLCNGEQYYGAITLERSEEEGFSEGEVGVCYELAALAGAALLEKWRNDRPLPVKIRDAAAVQLKRLFGPKYIGRKLVAFSVSLLIICCALLQGDYRLSAETVLEGAVQRMIVAPYDGYIAESELRAGDVVEAGELLCSLDDRDLRLERLNWLSQRSQLQKQRQDALAKHDRVQVKVLSAQLEQADAQLELIGAKLERSLLRAPFRGLVTSGDLTQRLGGAVRQGDVLFEIAPLDGYRVILKVDERRISDVRIGQVGELVLTSLPEESFEIEVTKITPITIAEEGMNYFRVDAQLEESHESLRPGMEGVGKIMIDRRNLFGILTRDLREWLVMRTWSWWP